MVALSKRSIFDRPQLQPDDAILAPYDSKSERLDLHNPRQAQRSLGKPVIISLCLKGKTVVIVLPYRQ